MNETPRRYVFFVSDRTGLTSENMGEALLEQFPNFNFKRATYPFLDTVEKAHALVQIINQAAEQSQMKPLVFSSVANDNIREIVKTSQGLHLSFFDAFLGKLESELGMTARHSVQGRVQNVEKYDARMEAVNFALNHDDGVSDRNLQEADVILMGVSRSGKTPTCLYLALQYGIRAANYPLTPDDLDTTDLPRMVKPYHKKLFGLTIQPDRLHQIRQERRPDSRYSHPNTCKQEVADAQAMFRRHNIPFANTTHKSVEELAVSIMQECALKRRF
ncbi:posphoenolpyruvate synthetase regulatory kinase/phosphorylase PpsR [Wielerella bovis]|uniref:posphoenolpyruvate synthetase regulatory kinase/phosphorylase PpsR n=1 Tax=Wielerella bovis TaxID=2917790 RepID=UPI002018C269|nr:pyruvate, water dikinase regulatory protein [Wielerella bovis]ULJ63760.1 kinase/pyrophosphorylase [Wielerella bovis]ULJ66072.1 kinase/pyrophosphorylase [Wielerella bovis]